MRSATSPNGVAIVLQRAGAALILTAMLATPLLPLHASASFIFAAKALQTAPPATASATPSIAPVTKAPVPSLPPETPRRHTGEFTITNRIDSFSSAGNVYGPWQTQALEYQWQAGKRDIPSFTVLNRNDRDRNAFGQPVPSHSTALYVDDYHNWSKSFFTYVQGMTSSGNILPNRLLYVEADQKLLRKRNLVMALGGSTYANPDGSATRSLSIGPTLYEASMVYTVRYLPAAVSGSFSGFDNNGLPISGTMKSYGSGLELVAEYNKLGSNQITATYLGGNQPGILVGSLGALPAQFTNIQRIGEFDLTVKHWFRKDFGFVAGVTIASHSMQSTGAKIYNDDAFTAGLFFGRNVGLP